jgi:hypothetical protein
VFGTKCHKHFLAHWLVQCISRYQTCIHAIGGHTRYWLC